MPRGGVRPNAGGRRAGAGRKKKAPSTLPQEVAAPVVASVDAIDHRHQIVAEGYLVHGNAAQAARDAGYAPESANVTACRILARPEVSAYLSSRKTEIVAATGLDPARTINELKAIAHSRIDHYGLDEAGMLTLANDAPPDAMNAVASFKRTHRSIPRKDEDPIEITTSEFRLWPKMEAVRMQGEILELVGRNALPAPVRTALAIESKGSDGKTLRVLVAMVAE